MRDVIAPNEGVAPALTGFHRELAAAMSSPAARDMSDRRREDTRAQSGPDQLPQIIINDGKPFPPLPHVGKVQRETEPKIETDQQKDSDQKEKAEPESKLPAQNMLKDALTIGKDIGEGIMGGALNLTANDLQNLAMAGIAMRAPGLLQTEWKIGKQILPHASELLHDMSVISHQEDYSPKQVEQAHDNLRKLGGR